jgi:hypothetical protein
MDFKLTSKETGSRSKETEEKRNDLLSKWDNIMVNTQTNLQNDIDKYYEKLDKDE